MGIFRSRTAELAADVTRLKTDNRALLAAIAEKELMLRSLDHENAALRKENADLIKGVLGRVVKMTKQRDEVQASGRDAYNQKFVAGRAA